MGHLIPRERILTCFVFLFPSLCLGAGGMLSQQGALYRICPNAAFSRAESTAPCPPSKLPCLFSGDNIFGVLLDRMWSVLHHGRTAVAGSPSLEMALEPVPPVRGVGPCRGCESIPHSHQSFHLQSTGSLSPRVKV